MDWPPALHAWPGRLVEDYPGAEPLSLVVGWGGDGDGGRGSPKTVRPLVRAPGAGSWRRCLGDGDAKGTACMCLCMWSSGEGIPLAQVPFGDQL